MIMNNCQSQLSAVDQAVISNALILAANEMGAKLIRAAIAAVPDGDPGGRETDQSTI